MNLPTWDETDSLDRPSNPLEEFVHDHEPAAPHDAEWRKQLQALIDHVTAPRPKSADGGAPRPTKKAAAARHDPIIEGPGAVPVPTAAPPAGKSFKGTGKHYQDEDGQLREIGTWVNPAGEFEAARLTKETGVPHVVDPRTGDVVSAGGGSIAIEPPTLADPGPIVPTAFSAAMYDQRPVLGASARLPQPTHRTE